MVIVLIDVCMDGNSNGQGGSLTFFGSDLYISSVLFDNSLGNEKPQTGTLFSLGGKKHVEHL